MIVRGIFSQMSWVIFFPNSHLMGYSKYAGCVSSQVTNNRNMSACALMVQELEVAKIDTESHLYINWNPFQHYD